MCEVGKMRLDPTRSPHSPTTTTSMTAGDAGDDDIEERGDGSNDGLEDASDAIDDCHEAAADGLANVFDLSYQISCAQGGWYGNWEHTQETTAPILTVWR